MPQRAPAKTEPPCRTHWAVVPLTHVHWASGPALSLVCTVAGLVFAGASGRVLLTRSPASG